MIKDVNGNFSTGNNLKNNNTSSNYKNVFSNESFYVSDGSGEVIDTFELNLDEMDIDFSVTKGKNSSKEDVFEENGINPTDFGVLDYYSVFNNCSDILNSDASYDEKIDALIEADDTYSLLQGNIEGMKNDLEEVNSNIELIPKEDREFLDNFKSYDDYLQFKLKSHKDVNSILVKENMKKQEEYENFDELAELYFNLKSMQGGYEMTLKFIEADLKSRKEMYKYLIKYGTEAMEYEPIEFEVIEHGGIENGYNFVTADGSQINPLSETDFYYQNHVTHAKYRESDLLFASYQDPMIRKMYIYLYETQGEEAANNFVSDNQMTINKYSAYYQSINDIKKLLDGNGVVAFEEFGFGIDSGFASFFDGFSNYGDIYSENDYYKIYMREMLSRIDAFDTQAFENGHSTSFEFFPTFISLMIPGNYGVLAGSILSAWSNGGNTFRELRAKQYSDEEAFSIAFNESTFVFVRNLGLLGSANKILSKADVKLYVKVLASMGISCTENSAETIYEISTKYNENLKSGKYLALFKEYKKENNLTDSDYERFVYDQTLEEMGGVSGILISLGLSTATGGLTILGKQALSKFSEKSSIAKKIKKILEKRKPKADVVTDTTSTGEKPLGLSDLINLIKDQKIINNVDEVNNSSYFLFNH